MAKPYRTSQPPTDLSKPAPRMSDTTNPEIFRALQEALSRAQKQ